MNSRLPRVLLLSCLLTSSLSLAESPRALPAGTLPDDIRLQPLKDLNGYFPFTPPKSKSEWEQRAEQVRRQILVSQGLWPMPTRTALNPVIHGRIVQPEYTIDKVFFESAPGFYVTGNLYKPAKVTGKIPCVLFTHGHWQDARLSEETRAKLRVEIATGQERFEEGGKSRFQSMCVQLARMGCMVWQYDMLSDSDSVQIPRAVIHTFAKQRPEMNTAERWGLYSPQAEAHLQSVMGLQTWNSIRSLDFLLALPDIDPERIAITGASGGGTQTMLLAAIDPRVKLSFPAVMVSTAMQGGCTCESSSLLRVNTGNVEFAALFAPKPQGMTTANDWTKEMSTKGFPELQQLYALMGAPKNVMLQRGEHFPHNYNAVTRSAFYGWLNQHFKLGQEMPVIERDYPLLKREQLTVWDAQHPAPKAADPEFERSLLEWLTKDTEQQLEKLPPAERRTQILQAVELLIGRTYAQAGEIDWERKTKQDAGSYLEMTGLVTNKTYHEELPTLWLYPKNWDGRAVIWPTSDGKAGLLTPEGAPLPSVKRLVESGALVIGVDLLFQGEFQADGRRLDQTGLVKNPREFAGYTFGYNHAVFAQRVHDLLTTISFLKNSRVGQHPSPKQVFLTGFDNMAPLSAAARALAGGAVDRLALSTGGFRFGKLLDYRHPHFLPGGAKYQDLPGLLALSAPQPLWVSDEKLPLVTETYRAAGQEQALVIHQAESPDWTNDAVTWLLK